MKPAARRSPTPDRDLELDALDGAVAGYAHNLLAGTYLRKLEKEDVGSFQSVGLLAGLARTTARGAAKNRDGEEIPRAKLRRMLSRYLAAAPVPVPPPPPKGALGARIAALGAKLQLDLVQLALVQFLVVLRESRALRQFVDAFGDVTLREVISLLSAATAFPKDRVIPAVSPDSLLSAAGLIEISEERLEHFANKIRVSTVVMRATSDARRDDAPFPSRLFPARPPTSLDWSDYAPLEQSGATAIRLLGEAVRTRRRGVNILIYGGTGTGKTALASLLAREAGAALYDVGCMEPPSRAPSLRARVQSLALAERLLGASPALLLFDGADELVRHRWSGAPDGFAPAADVTSPQRLRHLLEGNAVPTLWTAESAGHFERVLLRRFSYALELPPSAPRQRAVTLRHHLGADAAVPPSDVDAIAERFNASPAQLASAVAAARLIAPEGRPDRAAIETVLAPLEKLRTGKDPMRRLPFDASRYSVEALSSTDDLEAIAARLEAWRPGAGPGLSLCLYGPPGTGKSEYVKYLAHRMGRPIVYRRVSDILSMWVGENERKIAEAFREAEDGDALLLFDEADTFLRDRTKASRSWEVSEVNEFLQQLESFRGIVACTTNLWTDLDPASLRRFVLKVEFGFLEPHQSAALFHKMFAGLLPAAPSDPLSPDLAARLGSLANLTPGDFAVVARRERALGTSPAVADLVALLEAEVRAKPGAGTRVGF